MDFNVSEIVILVVLGVIIFGPEKLPELARKAARVVAYLRGIANNARSQLREELGPEFADIRLADLNPRALAGRILSAEDMADLQDIKNEIRGVGSELSTSASDVAAAVKAQPTPLTVAFDPQST